LTGLGGSAISGDLLRSYLSRELTVPFLVNRQYQLPSFVDRNTLVIVSSYSGNTEETIAAHADAVRRRARVLCISSGGRISDTARRRRTPLITIPGGLPPRAALGYSFFPLLISLSRLGFIKDRTRDIRETQQLLERKAAEYSVVDETLNPALRYAGLLAGKIGVLYASSDLLEPVVTRWKGQINENAKSLAFGNLLPEMNHNEIVGWKALRDAMRQMQIVFLRDRDDNPRVQRRIEITHELLRERTPHITEVWSEGTSRLARLFSLIHMGDWLSVYLAVLHREDPTPVAAIDHLKEALARS
jgi:glucose/mannose-6-phosphate isomerase